MFLRDQDPVSVQCLACGAGEILDGLVPQTGREPFATSIRQNRPDLDEMAIRRIRNQYWNAFKHLYSRKKGILRNDVELLARFSDVQNDGALFIGWTDYMTLRRKMPVSAQVFDAWYCAIYEEKLHPTIDLCAVRRVFPGIRAQERADQKRRLKLMVEEWEHREDILRDPSTEPGPLIVQGALLIEGIASVGT